MADDTAVVRALLDRHGWTYSAQIGFSPERAGYARYDERTAAMLGETAELVLDRWSGDLRKLREEAGAGANGPRRRRGDRPQQRLMPPRPDLTDEAQAGKDDSMADRINALEMIAQDHRELEELFGAFERSQDPDERTDIAHNVVHELAVHGEVEELFFYPRVREAAPDGGELADEAVHEHVEIKETLNELDAMTAWDEGFEGRMAELMAEVRHHVEEEEGEIFPAIREALSDEELVDLGERLQRAKSFVPTRPHPGAPTSPAGKAAAAPAASLVDRVRDALRNMTD